MIGKNCNLSQGVTLGQVNRGEKKDHLLLEIMFISVRVLKCLERLL